MKLYDAAAPNPRRTRIFVAEKGIDIDVVTLDFSKGDTQKPEFLKLNSQGLVPILELDDGRTICESVAISRYLEELYPDPPLFGVDAVDRALVEMWNRRAELQLMNTIAAIPRNTFDFFKGKFEQVPAYADAQRKQIVREFEWFDAEMADGRPYLSGDRFTIADITGMVAIGIADFVDVKVPANFKNVTAWVERLKARPSWTA